MHPFHALRVHKDAGVIRGRLESITLDDLSEGDVVIEAAYSGINFKDALAATGKGKICRRYPLVAGIDVSGTVAASAGGGFKEGDRVLAAGAGLGEVYDGGFAEYVRIPAGCVVPLPEGLSLFDAMVLGTAGFTAALALHRLEENHQDPGMGPIVITGASGGVGALAVDIFSGRGYDVTAVTGKEAQEEKLKQLGAKAILPACRIPTGDAPLEHALWGGALDTVGGDMLAWLTRTVRERGNIASIGLAGGHTLHTTVIPFILRGVSILGISSPICPPALRDRIWRRLGSELKPQHLNLIHSKTVPLDGILPVCDAMMARRTEGRTIVKIR